MKRAALGILLLPLLIFLPSQAQVPSSRAEEIQRQRAEADLARRMREMNLLKQRLAQATKKPIVPPAEPKLSDETRALILRQRRVAPADVAQYSAFLNTKGTGIVKIFPDLHCISK